MANKEINLKNALQKLHFHLQIQYSQQGIQSVSLHPSQQGFRWSFSMHEQDVHIENSVNQWMEAYCQKQHPSIELPFDWTVVSSFTCQALKVVASIPFGSVLTYGQVADLLDRPEAARAVGGACRRNPFLLFIPCHRVLDAKFHLRGYSAGGLSVKQKLLDFEEIQL